MKKLSLDYLDDFNLFQIPVCIYCINFISAGSLSKLTYAPDPQSAES